MTEQVNPVIRLDLSTVDMDALESWRQHVLAASSLTDAQKADQNRRDLVTMTTARRWVADFRRTGARMLYLLVDADRLTKGDIGAVVVPLAGVGDTAALAKVFDANPTGPPKTAIVGNVLLYAQPAVLSQLVRKPGHARPQLMQALAAENGAFTMAAIPWALKDAPIVGGTGGIFSDEHWAGADWAGISLNPPPATSAHCTVQCRDDAAATALSDQLDKQIHAMTDDTFLRDRLGGDLARIADSMAARAAGSHVSLTMDNRAIDDLLMPLVMAKVGRNMDEEAQRAKFGGTGLGLPPSEADVAVILIACNKYRKDNNQQWPATLADLVPKYLKPENLKNPRYPDRAPGFIFMPPPPELSVADAKHFIVLYEAFTQQDTGSVYVGFADMHQENMTLDELKAALKR